MNVQFREFNPFDFWLWIEFQMVPSYLEKQYLEELINSWFFLGKLGGFNAENCQVQEAGVEISYMDYNHDVAEQSLMALMHNMGELDYQDNWARCWFDLGTSDGVALDVLINSLTQFSREYVNIKTLIIGGENEDWPVDASYRQPSFSQDN